MTQAETSSQYEAHVTQLSEEYPTIPQEVIRVAYLTGYSTGLKHAKEIYNPTQEPSVKYDSEGIAICPDCGERMMEVINQLPDVDSQEVLLECPRCK